MKKTGYREMLRDRCPKVVSHALKWCGVKEAWLDHVYENFIWMYCDNEERLKATKLVLGINEHEMKFVFEDTICEDNLTTEEKQKWNKVKHWVSWFQREYAYIENAYSISKTKGKDIRDIKLEIMKNYLQWMCPNNTDDEETKQRKNTAVNKFTDYLIDCFENNN